jgi:hypothetical protein
VSLTLLTVGCPGPADPRPRARDFHGGHAHRARVVWHVLPNGLLPAVVAGLGVPIRQPSAVCCFL